MESETCRWKYDSLNDIWEAECDAAWVFFEGGLAENDVKYCARCGGRIVVEESDDG